MKEILLFYIVSSIIYVLAIFLICYIFSRIDKE